ncbi:sugar transferase [candidate division WWE3 bacterium]|nr:sugar transferase [candidate division WWE3 bacterium]
MDLTVSVAALALFSPVAVIIMILIFLEDGAFPIYLQPRVGQRRKIFSFYKFRSMVKNADELLFSDPALLRRLRSGNHKLKDDPRITRVGRFIRKYSLDEFPQFINVLKGEMSFVGPRPFRPDELEKYETENGAVKAKLDRILSVKPGITGLWQTGGRSNLSFEERIDIEVEYASNYNLFSDLYIMLKTPIAVLQAKGAS